MGSPSVTSNNVWDVYRELCTRFYQLEGIPDEYEREWENNMTLARRESDARDANEMEIELLPDLRELAGGDNYMGGVNGGLGLGTHLSAIAVRLTLAQVGDCYRY